MFPKGDARRRAELHGFNRHPRTKIGGLPFCDGQSESRGVGQFLASFWGVCLATTICPWANQAAALKGHEGLSDDNFFLLGGYSRVDLFLDTDGSVECEANLD